MAVQTDQNMPECLIYAPLTPSSTLSYVIPYGREERQTGSAYAPESFAGNSHVVAVRALKHEELSEYRNLAINPCDLLQPENSSIPFFPHASSNSVSRSLFDFEARNAIDGRVQNGHHGVWPYQSWGPQLRTDIWWKVDFGRPVELDKVRLMIRADFPHDSYWKSAKVDFSDGSQIAIQITSSLLKANSLLAADCRCSARRSHEMVQSHRGGSLGTGPALVERESVSIEFLTS
jgi:hypothetical protein